MSHVCIKYDHFSLTYRSASMELSSRISRGRTSISASRAKRSLMKDWLTTPNANSCTVVSIVYLDRVLICSRNERASNRAEKMRHVNRHTAPHILKSHFLNETHFMGCQTKERVDLSHSQILYTKGWLDALPTLLKVLDVKSRQTLLRSEPSNR